MQSLNVALFEFFGAGHAPHPLLLAFASRVSSGAILISVLLLAWVVWRKPSQRLYALMTLAVLGLAAMSAQALASYFNMPRPFMMGLSPSYVGHGARGSLPSTHASVMFTGALLFCLRAQLRNVGYALFALALLTGWARIYVGVHFPLDIVAGLLLGCVFAAAVWLLLLANRRFLIPFLARSRAARPA